MISGQASVVENPDRRNSMIIPANREDKQTMNHLWLGAAHPRGPYITKNFVSDLAVVCFCVKIQAPKDFTGEKKGCAKLLSKN